MRIHEGICKFKFTKESVFATVHNTIPPLLCVLASHAQVLAGPMTWCLPQSLTRTPQVSEASRVTTSSHHMEQSCRHLSSSTQVMDIVVDRSSSRTHWACVVRFVVDAGRELVIDLVMNSRCERCLEVITNCFVVVSSLSVLLLLAAAASWSPLKSSLSSRTFFETEICKEAVQTCGNRNEPRLSMSTMKADTVKYVVVFVSS